MPAPTAVFAALREIMRTCEPELAVVHDREDSYYLNCRKPRAKNKDMFFGAVQVKKRYVSYYLMPLYVFPELTEGISEGLRRRRHGKSCFNFTRVDDGTFAELRMLTAAGLRRFRDASLL